MIKELKLVWMTCLSYLETSLLPFTRPGCSQLPENRVKFLEMKSSWRTQCLPWERRRSCPSENPFTVTEVYSF